LLRCCTNCFMSQPILTPCAIDTSGQPAALSSRRDARTQPSPSTASPVCTKSGHVCIPQPRPVRHVSLRHLFRNFIPSTTLSDSRSFGLLYILACVAPLAASLPSHELDVLRHFGHEAAQEPPRSAVLTAHHHRSTHPPALAQPCAGLTGA